MPPADGRTDLPLSADPVAAHAAMFDSVARGDSYADRPVPLDARRQTPARRASFAWFDRWLAAHDLSGKSALDLGCGRGAVSVQLALCGARVTGVDISADSLAGARELAARHGVADRVGFREGGAEALDFGDGAFDLVVCTGLMSFVDFDRVLAELARVVAPGGTAVLLDTLGHHPVAALGRRRKLARGKTTAFQVENILTAAHLARLSVRFADVDFRFFDLLSVPMIFVEDRLCRIHPALTAVTAPVSIALRAVDRVLLAAPPLRRYAFRVAIVMRDPHPNAGGRA